MFEIFKQQGSMHVKDIKSSETICINENSKTKKKIGSI